MVEGREGEQRFTRLAAAVGEPVRRYLVRRLPPDEVDDALAAVFLALWRRLDDVPADAALPWAYGVARHTVANARRQERRRRDLVERVTRLGRPREYAGPGPPAEPDEEAARLRSALARLGELDREVVRLWAWEELAPREIAQVLDLTPNAVSIRLTRAKRRLRETLEKDRPGKDRPASGHRPHEGSGT